VSPLEVKLSVLEFHGGELPPQDLHQEVAAPARWLQEAGVNALRLAFNRSSIASTIHAGEKTSPWSATRCLDLTRFMGYPLLTEFVTAH
jgi:hypothetical protein